MAFLVEYQKKSRYESLVTGITIETVLRYGGLETICDAKIDTGSQVCLFGRSFADSLEIDVEQGYREVFSTLTGKVTAYAHEVELETLGLRLQSFVYFAESYDIRRNLLGRQGWLQLVTLGLDDYHSELYLRANQQI
ncbi:MAG: aspartyl protease family protein [Blastocatellales bacterium]